MTIDNVKRNVYNDASMPVSSKTTKMSAQFEMEEKYYSTPQCRNCAVKKARK